jgi:hypothetical protein
MAGLFFAKKRNQMEKKKTEAVIFRLRFLYITLMNRMNKEVHQE